MVVSRAGRIDVQRQAGNSRAAIRRATPSAVGGTADVAETDEKYPVSSVDGYSGGSDRNAHVVRQDGLAGRRAMSASSSRDCAHISRRTWVLGVPLRRIFRLPRATAPTGIRRHAQKYAGMSPCGWLHCTPGHGVRRWRRVVRTQPPRQQRIPRSPTPGLTRRSRRRRHGHAQWQRQQQRR